MKRDKHAPKQKQMNIECEKKTGKNGTKHEREKIISMISMKRNKIKLELKKRTSQKHSEKQKNG